MREICRSLILINHKRFPDFHILSPKGTSPGPHSHRTRGTCMLIPHHLNPCISGIGYHWQLQQTPPGFLGKSTQDCCPKIPPPFPEKMTIRIWPPHAFEWGGGAWVISAGVMGSGPRGGTLYKMSIHTRMCR